MKTYHNDTALPVDITFAVGGGTKTVTVPPGSRLTFDDAEDNGQDILDACVNAGLTQQV